MLDAWRLLYHFSARDNFLILNFPLDAFHLWRHERDTRNLARGRAANVETRGNHFFRFVPDFGGVKLIVRNLERLLCRGNHFQIARDERGAEEIRVNGEDEEETWGIHRNYSAGFTLRNNSSARSR